MNNMLTLEEVRNFLEIDQDQLEKFLRERKLRAYKIGGTYLRFRKEEVINLRYEILPKQPGLETKISWFARFSEFWRFNNFYIISIAIVACLIVYFVRN